MLFENFRQIEHIALADRIDQILLFHFRLLEFQLRFVHAVLALVGRLLRPVKEVVLW